MIMYLHEFPLDIAHEILQIFALQYGVRETIRLRRVCSALDAPCKSWFELTYLGLFANVVETVLFALPTFRGEEDSSKTAALRPDPRMPPAVMARLVLSRVIAKHPVPLVARIQSAVRQACDFFKEEDLQNDMAGVYAGAAASSLSVQDIMHVQAPSSKLSATSTSLDLLIALARTGSPRLREMLDIANTSEHTTSAVFGSLYSAAAKHPRSIRDVAQADLSACSRFERRLRSCRVSCALQHAIEHNTLSIFLETYSDAIDPKSGYYEAAIIAALERSQVDSVIRLLDHISDPKTQEAYRLTAALAAARSGGSIWQQFLHDQISFVSTNAVEIILESACQGKHTELLKGIMEHVALESIRSSNVAYWAGRRGHIDILKILFGETGAVDSALALDALVGAAFHDASTLQQILTLLGCASTTIVDFHDSAVKLRQAVHVLLRETSRCVFEPSESKDLAELPEFFPSNPGAIELARACQKQDLRRALNILLDRQIPTEVVLGPCIAIAAQQKQLILLPLISSGHNALLPTIEALETRSTALFQVLLDCGWDVNGPHLDGNRSPMLGSVTDDYYLTQWFLDHGASVNVRGTWDITPMSAAAEKGSIATLQLLIQNGGDVRRGQLLHFASQRKDQHAFEVVDWLLTHNLSPNIVQFQDDPVSWMTHKWLGVGTALHAAIRAGHGDVVELLITHGSDPTLQDSCGKTAQQIAIAEGNSHIQELVANALARQNQS